MCEGLTERRPSCFPDGSRFTISSELPAYTASTHRDDDTNGPGWEPPKRHTGDAATAEPNGFGSEHS